MVIVIQPCPFHILQPQQRTPVPKLLITEILMRKAQSEAGTINILLLKGSSRLSKSSRDYLPTAGQPGEPLGVGGI